MFLVRYSGDSWFTATKLLGRRCSNVAELVDPEYLRKSLYRFNPEKIKDGEKIKITPFMKGASDNPHSTDITDNFMRRERCHLTNYDPSINRVCDNISITNYTDKTIWVKNRLGVTTRIEPHDDLCRNLGFNTRPSALDEPLRPKKKSGDLNDVKPKENIGIELAYSYAANTRSCTTTFDKKHHTPDTGEGKFDTLSNMLKEDIENGFRWQKDDFYPTYREAILSGGKLEGKIPMSISQISALPSGKEEIAFRDLSEFMNRESAKGYGDIYKLLINGDELKRVFDQDTLGYYCHELDVLIAGHDLTDVPHPYSIHEQRNNFYQEVDNAIRLINKETGSTDSLAIFVVSNDVDTRKSFYYILGPGLICDVPILPSFKTPLPPGLYVVGEKVFVGKIDSVESDMWDIHDNKNGLKYMRCTVDKAINHCMLSTDRASSIKLSLIYADLVKRNVNGVVSDHIKFETEKLKSSALERELAYKETQARRAQEERSIERCFDIAKVTVPLITAVIGAVTAFALKK